MLWVQISISERCTALCDKVCQWLATGLWFSPGPPVSSTNKTDHHDITEILLKVTLSIIKQTNKLSQLFLSFILLQNLVFIAVAIGIVFSFMFHLIVREKIKCNQEVEAEDPISSDRLISTIESSMLKKTLMTWKCWLKEIQFYQVCWRKSLKSVCFRHCSISTFSSETVFLY